VSQLNFSVLKEDEWVEPGQKVVVMDNASGELIEGFVLDERPAGANVQTGRGLLHAYYPDFVFMRLDCYILHGVVT